MPKWTPKPTPDTYPKDDEGRYWPLDANAALDWLKTATQSELDWYYDLMFNETPKYDA